MIPCPNTLALIQVGNGCAAWRVVWPMWELYLQGYMVAWSFSQSNQAARNQLFAECVMSHRSIWTPEDQHLAQKYVDELHTSGRAFIMEYDDDLFTEAIVERIRQTDDGHLASKSDQRLDLERRQHIFAMQLADGVIVSTKALKERVEQVVQDKPVIVVPNAIDQPRFKRGIEKGPQRPVDWPLTIGWAGGNRPDRDGELVAEAWRRIASRFSNVQFLVGGFPLKSLVESVPVSHLRLLPKTTLGLYPSTFAHIDIACLPLNHEPFNLCKSPIKAMECGLANATVVASPTVYGDFIEHGRTGLICNSVDEWEDALAWLIEDVEYRRFLSTNLREVIERDHVLDRTVERWPAAWTAITEHYYDKRRSA